MKKYMILTFLIIFISCSKNKKDKISQSIKIDKINLSEKTLLESNENHKQKEKPCIPKKIKAYINDPDTSGTNIRKKPKGDIIVVLNTIESDYILTLTEAHDGWFKIEGTIDGDEKEITMPNNKGWIHGSVISVSTRNYGGQTLKLLDEPVNGSIVTVIKKEVNLKLLDICNDWVKVDYNGIKGWIESKWLCGNPYTNCC